MDSKEISGRPCLSLGYPKIAVLTDVEGFLGGLESNPSYKQGFINRTAEHIVQLTPLGSLAPILNPVREPSEETKEEIEGLKRGLEVLGVDPGSEIASARNRLGVL